MTERARPYDLDTDDAFVAVLIAAMDASGHASPAEAERAHHIIWSMRRFHDREGGDVERRIERMRTLIGEHGAAAILAAAAGQIPERLRPSAFAIAADLVLVDGRMERLESTFLRRLSVDLGLDAAAADRILDVIRIKNSA